MATSQEILVSCNNRQPSERLVTAVKNCALGFRKLQDSIQETLDIGRNEGFKDIEIGVMIRQEMLVNNYSIRTVQRYLPASAKGKVRGIGSAEISDNLSLIQPANYESDQLAKYSKQFLIEVIRYLEEKYVIKHQKQAIKQVVKQVKATEPKQSKPRPIGKSPFSRNPVNKTPPDKINEILRLHGQGKSSREIARLTGVSKSAILRAVNSQDTFNQLA